MLSRQVVASNHLVAEWLLATTWFLRQLWLPRQGLVAEATHPPEIPQRTPLLLALPEPGALRASPFLLFLLVLQAGAGALHTRAVHILARLTVASSSPLK